MKKDTEATLKRAFEVLKREKGRKQGRGRMRERKKEQGRGGKNRRGGRKNILYSTIW